MSGQGDAAERVLYERRGCWKCVEVAHALERLGIEHRRVDVAWVPGGRARLEELTGEPYVPVLVDGDLVVWDRRRILRHLEEAHGDGPDPDAEALPAWMGGTRRLGDAPA
jgi:glutathione S-transferase